MEALQDLIKQEHDSTTGIDADVWIVKIGKIILHIHRIDFAGQIQSYLTHIMFVMFINTLYLLVCKVARHNNTTTKSSSTNTTTTTEVNTEREAELAYWIKWIRCVLPHQVAEALENNSIPARSMLALTHVDVMPKEKHVDVPLVLQSLHDQHFPTSNSSFNSARAPNMLIPQEGIELDYHNVENMREATNKLIDHMHKMTQGIYIPKICDCATSKIHTLRSECYQQHKPPVVSLSYFQQVVLDAYLCFVVDNDDDSSSSDTATTTTTTSSTTTTTTSSTTEEKLTMAIQYCESMCEIKIVGDLVILDPINWLSKVMSRIVGHQPLFTSALVCWRELVQSFKADKLATICDVEHLKAILTIMQESGLCFVINPHPQQPLYKPQSQHQLIHTTSTQQRDEITNDGNMFVFPSKLQPITQDQLKQIHTWPFQPTTSLTSTNTSTTTSVTRVGRCITCSPNSL
ncbi:MAG: hypothetical protein VXX80_10670, partial [Bacteroidota bacterium]|nr:hypothetical protein [Bacteroidota bacterium]